MKYTKLAFGITFILIILGLWTLWPTYQLYNEIPKQKRAIQSELAKAVTRDDSMRVMTERTSLQEKEAGLHKKALHLGLDLVGGMHMVLEVDKSKLTKEETRDATDRALAVIENRIDQFGVFEPVIQKVSGDRILVQLPGVDRERAKSLIGQVALLQFNIVAEAQKTNDLLKKIDDYYRIKNQEDTMLKEQGQFMNYIVTVNQSDVGVEETDYPEFSQMLVQAESLIPTDYMFLFGIQEETQGRRVRPLYLLKKQAELTGSAISDARPNPYQGSEAGLGNTWIVSLKLDRKAGAQFASVTGRNVGRRLAIVLDNVVRTAPVIKERIAGGEAMITTGDVNPDKAKDLAIVLRSGALPAPVSISEERSVGPSLGSDSIRRGVQAGLAGSLLVVIFMIIYYSASGLIADLSLLLNIFFIMVVMAGMKATLSLPGIAGIALTIGMAVDANILIFERIREELRAGKRIRAAIDAGYARAAVTIFDSNITTILTVLALYFFGTGAIRGFATTLTVGLVINIITAVYFSHFLFGWIVTQFPTEKLRI